MIVKNNRKLVEKTLDEAAVRALEAVGMKAETYASMLAPVDTGLLRNSITHALSGEPPAKRDYQADRGDGSGTYNGVAPDDGEPAVYIGTNVEYAPYVELGTYKRDLQDAQPFLKPAIQDHLDEYKRILRKHLQEA